MQALPWGHPHDKQGGPVSLSDSDGPGGHPPLTAPHTMASYQQLSLPAHLVYRSPSLPFAAAIELEEGNAGSRIYSPSHTTPTHSSALPLSAQLSSPPLVAHVSVTGGVSAFSGNLAVCHTPPAQATMAQELRQDGTRASADRLVTAAAAELVSKHHAHCPDDACSGGTSLSSLLPGFLTAQVAALVQHPSGDQTAATTTASGAAAAAAVAGTSAGQAGHAILTTKTTTAAANALHMPSITPGNSSPATEPHYKDSSSPSVAAVEDTTTCTTSAAVPVNLAELSAASYHPTSQHIHTPHATQRHWQRQRGPNEAVTTAAATATATTADTGTGPASTLQQLLLMPPNQAMPPTSGSVAYSEVDVVGRAGQWQQPPPIQGMPLSALILAASAGPLHHKLHPNGTSQMHAAADGGGGGGGGGASSLLDGGGSVVSDEDYLAYPLAVQGSQQAPHSTAAMTGLATETTALALAKPGGARAEAAAVGDTAAAGSASSFAAAAVLGGSPGSAATWGRLPALSTHLDRLRSLRGLKASVSDPSGLVSVIEDVVGEDVAPQQPATLLAGPSQHRNQPADKYLQWWRQKQQ